MVKWLLNVALDKWLHITFSVIIVCVVALLDVAEWHRPSVVAAAIGAFCAVFMDLLKEIVWDFMLQRGNFDIKDIAADFIGSLIGFFLAWAMLFVGGA